MKIASGKAESFIRKIDPTLFCALVYGPDLGLVSTRAEVIAKQIVPDLADPFSVVNLNYEQIKEDESVLLDELKAMNFGGGRRLVRLKDASNNLSAFLKKLMQEDVVDLARGSFLLITSGELDSRSSLRKLCEDSPQIAAIPCYVEDIRDLSRVIAEKLTAQNRKFNYEITNYIATHCQGDRMIVMQELEKLDLYLGDKQVIEFDDVVNSIGKTTETTLDDICESVASGDHKSTEKHFRKAQQQGVVAIALLRALQRYFMRLRQVHGQQVSGKSQDEAISSLRPPVFFKQKEKFTRHCTVWSRGNARKIDRALNELFDAELACKKTGSNPDLISNRCLMKISSLVN